MPQAGENFFNRKSSFPCDTLYVTAASNKQRGGRVRPTHKKSLQTLKRVWRAVEILSGRDKSAHQSTVFFIWWAVRPIHYKQRADESWGLSQIHRLCNYASGSWWMTISWFLILISVSFLHFGQNKGKLINIVSGRIWVLVFCLQIGQITHSFSCIWINSHIMN